MMSDEYGCVARGKLKLKSDCDKRNKRKKKDKKKKREQLEKTLEEEQKQAKSNGQSQLQMTKAEMAFKKQQAKIKEKRILEKAKLTHKQKVEKFNEHLDSLTEHFDIPKVSWTK